MKKILLIGVILVVGLGGYFLLRPNSKMIEQVMAPKSTVSPTSISSTDFTANFEIYTNGTKRVFMAAMYHNLSEDIYLTSDDPSVVHVKKAGVVWADLFETLAMDLTNECLITGTKQTFCTNDTHTLKFYINDQETPNALQQSINSGDILKVVYD